MEITVVNNTIEIIPQPPVVIEVNTATIVGGSGEKGEKGDTGETGLSAYELAVVEGFDGSIEQWLESLKGEQGESFTSARDETEFNFTIPVTEIQTGNIPLPNTCLITSITISEPTWFVLYNSEQAQIADQNRPITQDPLAGSGVLLEINNLNPNILYLSPVVLISSISEGEYYYKIENKGNNTELTMTISYLILEG